MLLLITHAHVFRVGSSLRSSAKFPAPIPIHHMPSPACCPPGHLEPWLLGAQHAARVLQVRIIGAGQVYMCVYLCCMWRFSIWNYMERYLTVALSEKWYSLQLYLEGRAHGTHIARIKPDSPS